MGASFVSDISAPFVGDASLRPQVLTADTNGGAVDMLLGDGPLHAVLDNGATDFASTDETYSVIIEESPVSNFASGVVALATLTVTAANGHQRKSVHTRQQRYVRARLDVGGTTPSIAISCALLSRRRISGSGSGFVS